MQGKITLENYQEIISIFCSRLELSKHNAHMALGIASEYFELLKAIRNNNIPNIIEEAGDFCFFVSQMARQNRLEFHVIFDLAMSRDVQWDDEMMVDILDIAKAKVAGYSKKYTTLEIENALVKALALVLSKVQTGNKSWEDILEINYFKLENRHGKRFNVDNLQTRNIDDEYKILSGNSSK